MVVFSLPNTELKGRTNLEHNRKQWRNLNYHRQQQAVEESSLLKGKKHTKSRHMEKETLPKAKGTHKEKKKINPVSS